MKAEDPVSKTALNTAAQTGDLSKVGGELPPPAPNGISSRTGQTEQAKDLANGCG
jgi:hypothetical protein